MHLMLGIDIGHRNIKASIFEGSFGRYKLQGFRTAQIPEDERAVEVRQDEALDELMRSIDTLFSTLIAHPNSRPEYLH